MSKVRGKRRGSKLKERIEAWKGIKGADIDEQTKSVSGFYYHKPGSQNPSK